MSSRGRTRGRPRRGGNSSESTSGSATRKLIHEGNGFEAWVRIKSCNSTPRALLHNVIAMTTLGGFWDRIDEVRIEANLGLESMICRPWQVTTLCRQLVDAGLLASRLKRFSSLAVSTVLSQPNSGCIRSSDLRWTL